MSEPEVLWVSKDGRCRTVVCDGGLVGIEYNGDHLMDKWCPGFSPVYRAEYHAVVIALFRERALGEKCDKQGVGRP